MKHINGFRIQGQLPRFLLLPVFLVIFFTACEPDIKNLGVDIFPSSDTMFIYTDTLTNLEISMVPARRLVTSVDYGTNDFSIVNYLGSIQDSMTGVSNAEIITQVSLAQISEFGANPTIDSLAFHLYVSKVLGDTLSEVHIQIFEFLDETLTLSDSTEYYSDYDVSGKYDPTPIVDDYFVPKPGTVFDFAIENEDFYNKVMDAAISDTIFKSNAELQKAFKGFYIKTDKVVSGGSMMKILLSSSYNGVKFKYYHDTLTQAERDTIPRSTYRFGLNQSVAQQVNILDHDFTGSTVEPYLNNPDAEPAIAYIQGLQGVNLKVSIPDIRESLGLEADEEIVLNTANLLFYVVPDSISGIDSEDYPDRLLLDTQLGEDEYSNIYDYAITSDPYYFGKLTRSNEQSAFFEPSYYYSFHLNRHLQAVLTGELENTDLIIFPEDPAKSDQIIKVWSNYSGMEGGLRLEIIYSKF